MAMNSSGMTGKIALKKEEFQEKREEHREKYEAKKEAFNEKYEVPVSERPSLARLTKADNLKFEGLGLFFVLMAGVCVLIAPWIAELSEPDGLQRVLEDVCNAGVGGVFILLAFQFLQIVVAFIPGEIVQIAAGMMYGPWIGALVVIVGAVISSAFIFAIVHKLGAPFVRAMIPEKWMSKLERFENSEKLDVMVFVLFLIPGLPKDVFTYLVPLTNMSMRNFVVLANIGRIPGVLISTLGADKLIEDYMKEAEGVEEPVVDGWPNEKLESYIQEKGIKCPECGKEMHRVPEVIDCWFDSGSMPFAQHHYPFENEKLFKEQYPADFISEAVDQTRGWFYSLMAISTLLFNQSPFRNVIVLGHVQDENGQKMSKSKGNAVDPMEALREYGADAIRWYFYSNSAPWLPNLFHKKAVLEGRCKFMGRLFNTYAFYVLYAEIDQFDPMKYTLDYGKLSVMDKWLLSKLNSTVKAVDANLAAYKIPETAKVLQEFVDDMSNWYVRRSRERFWAKGMEQDKINAYMTLYTALVTICKAAAPMIPFMTEEIYRNIVVNVDKNAPESIHFCDFPEVNEEWIDTKLEEDMDHVLQIVVQGRACRNTANIKNRQPIGKMYVKAAFELSDFYKDIIADELNVKEVVFTDDVSAFTSYSFKPQLRTVGPKYGKKLNAIRQYLGSVDGNAAMNELKTTGKLTFDADGDQVELLEEDLLIDAAQMPGYVSDTEYETTVVLDTNLTPELVEEGFVREIISKIQTMRKEAGFEVMDHIRVYFAQNDKIKTLVDSNNAEIKDEVLANEICFDTIKGYNKEWNINGETVVIGVEKENA